MFCSSTAPFVFFTLFLGAQSRGSIPPWPVSSPSSFELPEIDGSAVDTCRVFFDPDATTSNTATTANTTTTTTATTTTTKPVTKKQVAATPKKRSIQSPPRKPETKNTRTPIRPQPAPAGPITDSRLLYLLANRRGHAGSSNSFISQPMGRHRHRGYRVTSDSEESAGTLLKRAGRTGGNRRKIGSSSSEDSSDEA